MTIRLRNGRVLTRADADEWFAKLRECLEGRAAGLATDERQAAFGALTDVRNFLDLLDGFADALKPLDALLVAAIDASRGHRPALFSPRQTGGRPKTAVAFDTVRVTQIVAVRLAMRAGFKETLARELVADEFKDAKVLGAATESGVKEWRSAAGKHRRKQRAHDPAIAKRADEMLKDMLAGGVDVTSKASVREAIKRLAKIVAKRQRAKIP